MPTLKELQQQHPVGTKFRLPEHDVGFAIYFDGLEWLNYCGYPHWLDKRDALKHTWEVYQEPKKHVAWVSFVRHQCGTVVPYLWRTEELANTSAARGCKTLGVVKVEFIEGEGL